MGSNKNNKPRARNEKAKTYFYQLFTLFQYICQFDQSDTFKN